MYIYIYIVIIVWMGKKNYYKKCNDSTNIFQIAFLGRRPVPPPQVAYI